MCEHTRPRNLRFVYCHPSQLHLSLLCAKFATGCGRQLPVNALLYGSTNLIKVVYRLVIHGPGNHMLSPAPPIEHRATPCPIWSNSISLHYALRTCLAALDSFLKARPHFLTKEASGFVSVTMMWR